MFIHTYFMLVAKIFKLLCINVDIMDLKRDIWYGEFYQIQRLEIVDRENAGLKQMIDQQEKHVATLEREKEELTTELQTARAVVS